MIFKSRGNPTHSQYSIYFLIGFHLLSLSMCLGIGAYSFYEGSWLGFFLLIAGLISYIGQIIKVRRNFPKRKVTEMEIQEDQIILTYFHKHLKYGEAHIPRPGVTIFYEAYEGKDFLHSLKIVHPDGTPYFLENNLEMWNEDSIDEIFAMIKAMDYPIEVV